MTEWKEYKLGEITIEGKGSYGIAAPAVDFDINKYTYLRITDINDDGTINKNSLKSVDDINASNYLLKPNDIVFARTGASVGRSYFYDGKDGAFVYAGFLIKFSLNPDKVNPKILKYYTHSQSYYDWIVSVDNGATRGNINAQTYASMPIILPERKRQDEIVSILSSLDDKIDLLHRENKTLEAMAETLFRQWFIEEAKEDWEEEKLREIVDISIGRTPPRKETKWFSTNPSDVKWLSIKDMGEGDVFLFNTSEYLTKEAVETFSIPIIPKDTVVLSFKMTVGRVGITTEDMLSNEAIAHFKFTNKTPITKEYLYMFLKTYKYETLGSTSSIVTAINSAMIKNIEVTIPDADTMKRYKNQTQPMFDKIYNNQEQINTLIQIRDRLLPKLMSGEEKI